MVVYFVKQFGAQFGNKYQRTRCSCLDRRSTGHNRLQADFHGSRATTEARAHTLEPPRNAQSPPVPASSHVETTFCSNAPVFGCCSGSAAPCSRFFFKMKRSDQRIVFILKQYLYNDLATASQSRLETDLHTYGVFFVAPHEHRSAMALTRERGTEQRT